MKHILYTILFICTIIPAHTQQDKYFSHFMFGDMSFNPGAAGSLDMVCLTLISRQQWVGFEGNPTTAYFNGHTNFKLFNAEHGAGLTFNNDEIGFYKNLDFSLAYAYRFDVGSGKLGVGLNFGAFNSGLEPEFKVPQNVGNTFPFTFADASADQAIPAEKESLTVFDLGFGVFYKQERLYAGFSSTHFNQAKLKYQNVANAPNLVRHYYITSGYLLELNKTIDLNPSFLLNTDGYINQVILNTNAVYNKKILFGVSYRVGSAITGMIGFKDIFFKDVHIGYAYDFETTAIRRYSSGSHEIMLRYCFDVSVEKLPERYKSIRYL